MARTRHHHPRQAWKDPTWYRRMYSRLFRARSRQLVRIGRYDVLPLLKQRNYGWFW